MSAAGSQSSSAVGAEPVFTFDGYGAIRIGMTRSQVDAASHVPLAAYGNDRCTWMYDKQIADVQANPTQTAQITLDSQGVVRHVDLYVTLTARTDRGVGAGSTRDEILRAYPEPHQSVSTQAEDVLVIAGPVNDLSFVFDGSGRAEGIAIGYRGYAMGLEDCSG
jgi:hypothetical protein